MKKDNEQNEMVQNLKDWAEGKKELFVVRYYYGDAFCGHAGEDYILFKNPSRDYVLRDMQKAVGSLNKVVPEFAKIYKADYKNFLGLAAATLEDCGNNTTGDIVQYMSSILEALLDHEEKLTPVAFFFFPEFNHPDEKIFRSSLIDIIHSLVEEVRSTIVAQGHYVSVDRVPLAVLPPEAQQFVAAILTDKTTCTVEPVSGDFLVNGISAGLLNTDALQGLYDAFLRTVVDIFHRNIRFDKGGDSEKFVSCDHPKRRYRVALHWDVAYCDIIEADSEEEAIEKIREAAKDAPSSDWQFLQESEVEATIVKNQ